jgi:hypothetical protein
VIRILGTNKDGDILPDIWADVERIDRSVSTTQTIESGWQEVVRRWKWGDDPDSSSGVQDPRSRDGVIINPNASRDVITLKLCSPDEIDQSDPTQWIPIDVVKHLVLRDSGQDSQQRHVNTELNESRKVQQRRVSHYDTTIDDIANNAFQSDPNRKVFVQPGDQWTRVDGTKDDSQFVEVEVITSLVSRASGDFGSGNDQDEQTRLKNQYLIDESDPAQLTVIGQNGFNPPFRLDPYQNIINIQWGGGDIFLYGIRTPALDSGNLQVYYILDSNSGVIKRQDTIIEGDPPPTGPSSIGFTQSTFGDISDKALTQFILRLPSTLANGSSTLQMSGEVAFALSVVGGIAYIGSARDSTPTSFCAIMGYDFNTGDALWVANIDQDGLLGTYDNGVDVESPFISVQVTPGGGVVTGFAVNYTYDSTEGPIFTKKAIWGKFDKNGSVLWTGEYIGNPTGSGVPQALGPGVTMGRQK